MESLSLVGGLNPCRINFDPGITANNPRVATAKKPNPEITADNTKTAADKKPTVRPPPERQPIKNKYMADGASNKSINIPGATLEIAARRTKTKHVSKTAADIALFFCLQYYSTCIF